MSLQVTASGASLALGFALVAVTRVTVTCGVRSSRRGQAVKRMWVGALIAGRANSPKQASVLPSVMGCRLTSSMATNPLYARSGSSTALATPSNINCKRSREEERAKVSKEAQRAKVSPPKIESEMANVVLIRALAECKLLSE